MINPSQMKGLIKRVLQKIDLYSPEAAEFIYNIGLVESKYVYLEQIKGPARGMFQCESWVGVDIIKNYLQYRPDLMKLVASTCYLDWSYFTAPKEKDWEYILTTNIAAQIVFCRLHLRRIPKKLPRTLEEQAKQWKTYYNTAKGKGTPEKYCEIVQKYG
tara:strand:+ start:3495 stop:3971 length:477 start_codon:yes stop_codon:yes gene_type:complete